MNTTKKKTEYSTIRIDKSTYEKYRFVAKQSDMTISGLLREMADTLIQLCSRHDVNKFNLSFEYTVFPEPMIVIKTKGKSAFVIGQVTESEMERKERFDEVALDIAEARGKQIREKQK